MTDQGNSALNPQFRDRNFFASQRDLVYETLCEARDAAVSLGSNVQRYEEVLAFLFVEQFESGGVIFLELVYVEHLVLSPLPWVRAPLQRTVEEGRFGEGHYLYFDRRQSFMQSSRDTADRVRW